MSTHDRFHCITINTLLRTKRAGTDLWFQWFLSLLQDTDFCSQPRNLFLKKTERRIYCAQKTEAIKSFSTPLSNNYSPKWRWLVVGSYRAAKRRSKYLPLVTDNEVNSYLQWNNNAQCTFANHERTIQAFYGARFCTEFNGNQILTVCSLWYPSAWARTSLLLCLLYLCVIID